MRTTVQPEPDAQTLRSELEVKGMSCQNCVRHAREALEKVPGVSSATVSLPTERASVRWQPGSPARTSALIESLQSAGYPARVLDEPSCHADVSGEGRSGSWRTNLWIGVLGMLALMVGEWIFHLENQSWFRWGSFVMATIIQVLAGAPFYRGAWNQLRAGSSNMDTLVALGSTTAYLYSVFALFSGSAGHLYFMEAAAIISLISVGHWIEARVSAKASKSLEALLHLAPKTARRLRHGLEEEVPVEQLRIGDRVVLRAGDHVPTDGVIFEGSSTVDESMLTGESMPLEKSPGARVYAGTINLTGHLVLEVTATGEGTALANIIAAVERAQASRANIQRLGDRVSSVFVPIVVGIAVATGIFWAMAPEGARGVHDWLSGLLWHAHLPENRWAAAFIIPAAVLIVACPCAMGLATPAAIMAASNAASRRGILIRDGVALEKAGQVTAVLFDKTGTLTVGAPKVVATHFVDEGGDVDVVVTSGALAERSNHPLSRAIAEWAKRQGRLDGSAVTPQAKAPLGGFQEVRGAGLEAELGTRSGAMERVRLGSLRWLAESGVKIPEDLAFIREWSEEGATVLGLTVNERLLALFAVQDALKPDARQVVQQLSAARLEIYLVTGDNQRTAVSIARAAGIRAENVLAEIRPEEKADVVKRLQQGGKRVAFVGDGINDAPALEQADLGIAVSRASDVAREAADIILLNSQLAAVPQSLNLARATLRTIKQNLFWAFFYNALGVPLAALGFMSPILCAAAMGVSDIIVIGNALRLLRR